MHVPFPNDPKPKTLNSRESKLFRISVSLTLILEDDAIDGLEMMDVDHAELPVDSNGDVDEDAAEAMGLLYDDEREVYYRERDFVDSPPTVQDVIAALTRRYDSSIDFVEDRDASGQFFIKIEEASPSLQAAWNSAMANSDATFGAA